MTQYAEAVVVNYAIRPMRTATYGGEFRESDNGVCQTINVWIGIVDA